MAEKMYKVELEITGDDYTNGTMMMTEDQYRFLQRVCDPDNWDNMETGEYASSFCLHCEELDPEPLATATFGAIFDYRKKMNEEKERQEKEKQRKEMEAMCSSGFTSGIMANALKAMLSGSRT